MIVTLLVLGTSYNTILGKEWSKKPQLSRALVEKTNGEVVDIRQTPSGAHVVGDWSQR